MSTMDEISTMDAMEALDAPLDREIKPFSPRPVPPAILPSASTNKAIPSHWALMMSALTLGLPQLAIAIMDFDKRQGRNWQNSPLRGKDVEPEHIVSILALFTTPLLERIICGQLHTLQDSTSSPANLRTPMQHFIRFDHGIGAKDSVILNEERPVIYFLALCDSKGVTPTKRQMTAVLDKMIKYCKEYDDDSDAQWDDLDKLAKAIDFAKPIDKTRDWSNGGKYSYPKDSIHYRRYATNSNQKKQTKMFVKALRTRLRDVDDNVMDAPLPFSVPYIGWSRKMRKRQLDHYKHVTNTPSLKGLLEAAMHVVLPNVYFARMQPLCPVLALGDAAVGEHVLSILAGSYADWGGMNGSLGGAAQLETNLSRLASDETWKNAVKMTAAQGVLLMQKKELERQLEADTFYVQFKDAGSEMVVLEAARANTKELRESLDTKLKEDSDLQERILSSTDELQQSRDEAALLTAKLEATIAIRKMLEETRKD